MPISVEVYRGHGNRRGDEVSDPLIGDSLPAALARGRGELDASASARITTTLELVAPRMDLRLGDLVAVTDAAQGQSWRGKIVGIQHTCSLGAAPTTLTIERPTDG